MSSKWSINSVYQIQTEVKTVSSIKIEVVNLELFTKLDLRVLFYDENDNIIKCDYLTIDGTIYNDWVYYINGNRDSFIVQYVSNLYNIDYSLMTQKTENNGTENPGTENPE
jgi:hypothetical protein